MPNIYMDIFGGQENGIDIMYTDTRRGRSTTFIVDMATVMRPFQSKYFQTTRGRPQEEKIEDTVATFVLEATARVQITTLEGLGWKIKWDPETETEPDQDEEEVTRVTRTKRIYNPSDSQQYVDVEVIDAIEFKDQFNRKIRVKLNNS
jgi:hypothetical protein